MFVLSRQNKLLIVLSFFVCIFGLINFGIGNIFAVENMIKIYSNGDEEPINQSVFGNNLLGYEGGKSADYGYGIWDPKGNRLAEEVITLTKNAGVSILRFPGGEDANYYDWKKTIGKRRNFLFGLNEFLDVCKETGSEVVYTISYYGGSVDDAAHLVEYLNSNIGTSSWALERQRNGHREPYGVKYFEIGNEIYLGDKRKRTKTSAEDYARKYLQYYEAMKKVDPGIALGVVLFDDNWNRIVLEIIKGKIDFGIIHFYPSPVIKSNRLSEASLKDIFLPLFAKPIVREEIILKQTLSLIMQKAGKDVPLAITEYNGEFVQEKPVPFRHALGNALMIADLLRIFMKSENNILMANYWNFCNEYWGMVANGFDGTYKTLYNPYYKRPNYYVFEMYHKHFGDLLLDVDVKCDTYDVGVYQPIKSLIKRIKTGTVIKNNLVAGDWKIQSISGVAAVNRDRVLGIEFRDPQQFNYYHSRMFAQVEPNTYYKLSGYIKTDGLQDPNGVCLEVQDDRGWAQTKSAISTEKITGTKDWQHVEAIYQTLPDGKGVNVIARRIGESGPLKGKAYFRDVKLEKFIPSLDTKIPYLSVNASKSKGGNKVYLMVINKNMENSMTSTIELKDFVPAAEGNAWVLNGPSVDATNEKIRDNVKVTHHSFKVNSNPFEFTFEPHSLTAIEIASAASQPRNDK